MLRAMRCMRWTTLALLAACSRPPGAPDAREANELGARVVEVQAASGAVQALAAEENVPAYEGLWPTDGSLPGSDEPRVRVSIDGAPAKGASEPAVTVVVFSDFECPFCSRLNPTIDRLLTDYPDDVRVVFRQFPLPFHRNAQRAHEAALEARAQRGDSAFWAMHDLLFQNQRALSPGDLERYAASLGLDVSAFRAALDDHRHAAAIERDVALGQRAGVTGTPATFLNGRLVSGARPYADFEAIVDEELDLAAQAMRAGVPRRHLYAAVLSAASETPSAAPTRPPPPPREPERPEPSADAVFNVPIDGSPAVGPATALVTMVEFADMECPFCMRAQPTIDALRERYGRDLRIVWKHNPLPFHQRAMPAAIALEEARAQRGDRGFWRMHARIVEAPRQLDREHLEAHARAIGLNMRRFRRALDEETHRAAVEEDMALARRLGATGTPTFFVNGVKIVGAQALETFTSRIDELIADARERVSAGAPRRRLYEALVADGIADIEQWRESRQQPVELPVPEHAPVRGAPHGAVTVQVLSDFECPFCARARPVIEQLLDAYPSQVRVVFRHYPLDIHRHAELAAEAAIEVHAQGGSDAFWAYHDLLFDNQRVLERADLERYAEQVGGVDMIRFRDALDRRTHRATVRADVAAIEQATGRIGTPSLLIGGRLVRGAQSFETLRDAVERALEGLPPR